MRAHERARARELGVELHDPVDLGCFAVRTTDERARASSTGRVDEHFDLTTDQRVARGARDGFLHRFALAHPLDREVGVDRVGQRRRGRAVLG